MATFFGFIKKRENSIVQDLRNPFCACMKKGAFVEATLNIIWARVLQNTLRRCVFKSKNDDEIMRSWGFSAQYGKGLVDYVAAAMSDCTSVYLTFESGVLREMTDEEKKDFIAGGGIGKGKIGLEFSDFKKSDIARFYLEQLYQINQTRMTQWGIAGSLILRLNGVRDLVASNKIFDKDAASSIVSAVRRGEAVEVDGGDKIGGVDSIHTDIISQGRNSVVDDMAFALGLPSSMLTQKTTTGGLSVDAEADVISEAEALEFYFYAICEPVLKQLYSVADVTYRNDRYLSLESRLRSLAMLEASEYWSTLDDKEKEKIWDELLGFQDTNTTKNFN